MPLELEGDDAIRAAKLAAIKQAYSQRTGKTVGSGAALAFEQAPPPPPAVPSGKRLGRPPSAAYHPVLAAALAIEAEGNDATTDAVCERVGDALARDQVSKLLTKLRLAGKIKRISRGHAQRGPRPNRPKPGLPARVAPPASEYLAVAPEPFHSPEPPAIEPTILEPITSVPLHVELAAIGNIDAALRSLPTGPSRARVAAYAISRMTEALS